MRETDRRFGKFPEINIPIGVENSESDVVIEIESVSLRRYESVSCLIVRVKSSCSVYFLASSSLVISLCLSFLVSKLLPEIKNI